MPELPEVEIIASELNRKLKNKIIKSVVVKAPKMVAIGPDVVSNTRIVKSYKVIKFIKLLKRQRILSVRRRAKLLIINLSPSATGGGPSPNHGEDKEVRASLLLLVHLKMTGQFIYEDKKLRAKTRGYYRLINTLTAPKELLPSKHTHVIFIFNDGSRLFFNDIRKFGYLKIVRDDEIGRVKDLSEFGPEPLDKKFTLKAFEFTVGKKPKGKIKQVLMDPKVVAGIGNIYSDEILFHAGVKPERKVASIKNQELREIYKNIKEVLSRAIKAKGSSVGDFVRTDGSWGQMGKLHFVYGRSGEKCKKCSSIIKSIKLNGRTGSYCPRCQK